MPGRVAKSGSRDRLCATPPHLLTLPRRRRLPLGRRRRRRSRRAASDAQRILHKLRALTTDNQAIPAAARNLLFFFLRPSVYLSLSLLLSPSPFCPLCHPLLPATPPLPSRPHQPSLLPPLAPRPSRRRTPPRPPPPPPPLRLPLLRLSVSSSRGELRYSRKAHVSARIAVACTRRYASSSTFVTSQPPRTLRLLLAAVPFSLSLSPSNLSSSTSFPSSLPR